MKPTYPFEMTIRGKDWNRLHLDQQNYISKFANWKETDPDGEVTLSFSLEMGFHFNNALNILFLLRVDWFACTRFQVKESRGCPQGHLGDEGKDGGE